LRTSGGGACNIKKPCGGTGTGLRLAGASLDDDADEVSGGSDDSRALGGAGFLRFFFFLFVFPDDSQSDS
jgi:hypothetical protein